MIAKLLDKLIAKLLDKLIAKLNELNRYKSCSESCRQSCQQCLPTNLKSHLKATTAHAKAHGVHVHVVFAHGGTRFCVVKFVFGIVVVGSAQKGGGGFIVSVYWGR